mmetsp:Transcript_44810/g.115979  ORF Transcript_44810/g.115979 Transcript_44810/m.115979 type:complete len:210 (+) Transcript_44810:947-1576(+)
MLVHRGQQPRHEHILVEDMVILEVNPELRDHEVEENVKGVRLAPVVRILEDEGAFLVRWPSVRLVDVDSATAREEGLHLMAGLLHGRPCERPVEVQGITLVPVIGDQELPDVEVTLPHVPEHGAQGLPEHDAAGVHVKERGHGERDLSHRVAVAVDGWRHSLQGACLRQPVYYMERGRGRSPFEEVPIGGKVFAVVLVHSEDILARIFF